MRPSACAVQVTWPPTSYCSRSTSLTTRRAGAPGGAYKPCFGGEGRGGAAAGVLMTSLSAGDHVLTQAADGALAHTRVILNQHKVARDADPSSPLPTPYHGPATPGPPPDR